MSALGYRPISWQNNDLLGQDKLNQGVQNIEYVLNNMTRSFYRAHGATREEGNKLLSGLALIPASKRSRDTVRVHFPNYFSSACSPIVTTGIVSAHLHRVHVTIAGLGRMHPDHRGMEVHISMDAINAKRNHVHHNFYVSYSAHGF